MGETVAADLNLKVRGKLKGLVYQGTSAAFANAGTPHDPRLQIRINPDKFDPRTPEQVVQRTKLKDAVSAWSALSEAEKSVYKRRARTEFYYHRDRGKQFYLSGYNLFISKFIINNSSSIS